MEQEAQTIEFIPSGRGKARCEANPDFPNGIEVDVSDGKKGCVIKLPYPAPECGVWVVRCNACNTSIGVTAAGRIDDPISVKIACKFIGTEN